MCGREKPKLSSCSGLRTVALHDLEELDDDLGARSDQDLTLAGLLGIVDGVEGVVENGSANHFGGVVRRFSSRAGNEVSAKEKSVLASRGREQEECPPGINYRGGFCRSFSKRRSVSRASRDQVLDVFRQHCQHKSRPHPSRRPGLLSPTTIRGIILLDSESLSVLARILHTSAVALSALDGWRDCRESRKKKRRAHRLGAVSLVGGANWSDFVCPGGPCT